jgi:hypothetical protein
VIPVSELRPLAVGEIVDSAFKLLRRNARILYPISVVVLVPVGILQAVLLASQGASIDFAPLLDPTITPTQAEQAFSGFLDSYLALAAGTLVSFMAGLLVQGGTTWAVAAAYEGNPPGWKTALRQGFRRFPAVFVAVLAIGIASTVGLVFCLAPGVFLFICWSVAIPALVHERLGPFSAMRRSYRLVRRRFWPAMGAVILAYLVYYVLSQIVSAAAVAATFIGLATSTDYSLFPSLLASELVSVLVVPFIACVVTVLYFDLRIRAEGYDLERAINALAGDPSKPAPRPVSEDPFG